MPANKLDFISSPNAESLKPFAGSVGNLKSLGSMAGAAKGASLKFFQTLARLNLTAQKQRQEFALNLDRAGVTGKDAQKLLQQNAAQIRKQLTADSQKERASTFAPILQAKNAISYMKRDGVHPKNLATAFRVTDPARAAMFHMVESMAAGGLAALARQVAADPTTDENKMLAACLILKNDSLPPDARPFSSLELASICFQKESDTARELISSIEEAADSVQAINSAWENGKPIPSNVKLALGLAYEGINISQAIEGDDPAATVEALSSLAKIAGGLANLPGAASPREVVEEETPAAKLAKEEKTRKDNDESWAAIMKEAARLDALDAAAA